MQRLKFQSIYQLPIDHHNTNGQSTTIKSGVLMKAGYWQSAPACKTSNHCLFSMPLKPPKGKEALKPMYQAKTPNTPSKAT